MARVQVVVTSPDAPGGYGIGGDDRLLFTIDESCVNGETIAAATAEPLGQA